MFEAVLMSTHNQCFEPFFQMIFSNFITEKYLFITRTSVFVMVLELCYIYWTNTVRDHSFNIKFQEDFKLLVK